MTDELRINDQEYCTDAWDSTCECCGFHYFNPHGNGPMRVSDNHGSNGWKTDDELKDDLLEGFLFLAPALTAMQSNGWEVICGECVDNIIWTEA